MLNILTFISFGPKMKKKEFLWASKIKLRLQSFLCNNSDRPAVAWGASLVLKRTLTYPAEYIRVYTIQYTGYTIHYSNIRHSTCYWPNWISLTNSVGDRKVCKKIEK